MDLKSEMGIKSANDFKRVMDKKNGTDLKGVSDTELLMRTEKAVQLEREMTLSVLKHLREIERRRLFSTLGCSSLFLYCVEKLGYSESAALRRISSMRALRDLPELAGKIESGKLSLSTVASAQTFLSQERRGGREFTRIEKLRLFESLEGKSRREADKMMEEKRSFESHPPAEVRMLKGDKVLLSLVVNNEFEQKLEKLKGRLAHKMPRSKKLALRLIRKRFIPWMVGTVNQVELRRSNSSKNVGYALFRFAKIDTDEDR